MKSTKELARQLGLLRRRSSTTQQSRDVRKVKKTNQIFSYLIVIDFESTCWKDKKTVNQEVIEFPAVLLNTSTGSIESEFHTYVLPEENPQLSAFCTELTGITQDQVEAGIPLRVCLSKFSRWLKKQEDEKNIAYNTGEEGRRLCTFVTWSDWDLSVCLHYECRRKQLLKPPSLNSWIDLRATYKNFYQRKPNGLHGALQDVGIEFQGRQHSGLDDARNTAFLAWRLMCDGCVMKITRTMPGTNQLKRKQATHPSEQLAKSQTKPHTNLQRQQPDIPMTNRCTEPEDRLVSYTQGISEETVYRDVTMETPALNSRHFKIWQDDSQLQLGPVHSVITLKTSLPTTITNGPADDKNCSKPDCVDQASALVCVQTRHKDKFLARSNRHAEKKLQNLDKEKGTPCIQNTTFSLSSGDGNANSSSKCSSRPVFSKFDSTRTSSEHHLGPKPTAFAKAGKEELNSPQNSGSHTPTNSNKCTDQAILRPQLKGFPAPVVFKTPLTTPLLSKSARKPSPSSGLETPYASGCCQTPGSTTFRTPTQSNRRLTAPPLFGGKITPPMCQCGRRAKRHIVQSPGPNVNRTFYSCTLGRRSSEKGLQDVTNTKKGCGYFKWESTFLAEKRLSLSTSPVTQQSRLAQKQKRAVHTTGYVKPLVSTSNNTTTPVGCTGKRLGITMRAVLGQQKQMNMN